MNFKLTRKYREIMSFSSFQFVRFLSTYRPPEVAEEEVDSLEFHVMIESDHTSAVWAAINLVEKIEETSEAPTIAGAHLIFRSNNKTRKVRYVGGGIDFLKEGLENDKFSIEENIKVDSGTLTMTGFSVWGVHTSTSNETGEIRQIPFVVIAINPVLSTEELSKWFDSHVMSSMFS